MPNVCLYGSLAPMYPTANLTHPIRGRANFFKAEDVIDTIYLILVEAVDRKWERRYQSIISSLMKVSMLKEILKSDVNKGSSPDRVGKQ